METDGQFLPTEKAVWILSVYINCLLFLYLITYVLFNGFDRRLRLFDSERNFKGISAPT
jgi:hypothetical protein